MEQCLQCRYFCINLMSDLCGFSEQRARLGYLAFRQIDSGLVRWRKKKWSTPIYRSMFNVQVFRMRLHLQNRSREKKKQPQSQSFVRGSCRAYGNGNDLSEKETHAYLPTSFVEILSTQSSTTIYSVLYRK